jgi:hypothetical protein
MIARALCSRCRLVALTFCAAARRYASIMCGARYSAQRAIASRWTVGEM